MSEPPTLSKSSAFWLAAAVASSYVFSVYVSQLVAPSRPPFWRNDTKVVQARLLCASASTLLCCIAVGWIVKVTTVDGTSAGVLTLRLLGISDHIPPTISVSSFKQLAITPLLFLGPLYAQLLSRRLPLMQDWSYKEDVSGMFFNWVGFRNFFMGPFTEEVNYRSCVLAIMHLGGYGKRVMIFAAPCWFGLAHIHHGYETYKRFGKTASALRSALISTVFQFVYTTIFGWLSSYLFLRTGSLFVVTSAHIFCNIMGFPQLSNEILDHPNRKHSIITVYILGIILFAVTLVPWSQSNDSIFWTS